MAEDIDIIALWEKGKSVDNTPEIDVDQTIGKRSKNTLYWIKVILTIEFWLNLLMIPLTVYFLIYKEADYVWGGLATVITFGYLFYYQFLIKQVTQFSFEEDVRTSLKKLYGYLRFFVLHYKVVIWIAIILGLLRSYTVDVPNQIPPEQLADPNFWPMMIAVTVPFAIIIGLIITWLVHLIYGKKIKRLKKLVKEFSE